MRVVAHDDGGLPNYLGGPNPSDDTAEPVDIAISIFAVDDPPVADDDPPAQCPETQGGSYVIPEDGGPIPLGYTLGCALLSNDADVDTSTNSLTWELLEPPSHGTLIKQGNYQMTFEPEADYGTRRGDAPGGTWVSDSFTYRAFNGGLYSESATARFWIAEINDAPSFTPGTDVAIAEDSASYGAAWAFAISPGPQSESWQSVTFEITDVSVSGGGTLFATLPAIDADGVLTFAALPGASGTAQVTVQAQDDGGLDDHGIERWSSLPMTRATP